jgi:hypothetical protein
LNIIILQHHPEIAAIVRLVSRKKKAILAPRTNAVRLGGTYWDEGSRCEYFLINIRTSGVVQLGCVSPPQFGGPKEDPIQPLEEGYAVVAAGTFCGKPATPIVYLPREE